MIGGDDDGGGHQHSPVAIEREERERAEHVKVGLDPAAGEVDEQRRPQHLRRRDHVARRGPAWSKEAQQRREQTDGPAEENRGPDVDVGATGRATTRQWRHPQREDDAGNPLKAHQAGEQPVGVPVDLLLVRGEELARPGIDRRSQRSAGIRLQSSS